MHPVLLSSRAHHDFYEYTVTDTGFKGSHRKLMAQLHTMVFDLHIACACAPAYFKPPLKVLKYMISVNVM